MPVMTSSTAPSSFTDILLGYLNGRSSIDLSQRNMQTIPDYVSTQYSVPNQQGGASVLSGLPSTTLIFGGVAILALVFVLVMMRKR